MRKLVTAVAAVAVLCGMTVFAQTPVQMPAQTPTPKPQPPMAHHEHMILAAGEFEALHMALMESKHDPETLKLVTNALADRKAMLNGELERMQKMEAVVKAMKSEDKAELQQAREALKGTMEELVAKAKAF